MSNSNGILYIVATPIGNLQDITQRALETFQQVDLIAAEDTRHSGLLLAHYGIKKPFFALHDHNEQQKAGALVEKLLQGVNIALISDAGTPLISDPGFHVVRQCRQAGIQVVPLPGACAAITALCASGIASDRFCFEGFLPAKSKAVVSASTNVKTILLRIKPPPGFYIIDILNLASLRIKAPTVIKVFHTKLHLITIPRSKQQ